jgi:hypothetical protein
MVDDGGVISRKKVREATNTHRQTRLMCEGGHSMPGLWLKPEYDFHFAGIGACGCEKRLQNLFDLRGDFRARMSERLGRRVPAVRPYSFQSKAYI